MVDFETKLPSSNVESGGLGHDWDTIFELRERQNVLAH
jgi:hypothetical protein